MSASSLATSLSMAATVKQHQSLPLLPIVRKTSSMQPATMGIRKESAKSMTPSAGGGELHTSAGSSSGGRVLQPNATPSSNVPPPPHNSSRRDSNVSNTSNALGQPTSTPHHQRQAQARGGLLVSNATSPTTSASASPPSPRGPINENSNQLIPSSAITEANPPKGENSSGGKSIVIGPRRNQMAAVIVTSALPSVADDVATDDRPLTLFHGDERKQNVNDHHQVGESICSSSSSSTMMMAAGVVVNVAPSAPSTLAPLQRTPSMSVGGGSSSATDKRSQVSTTGVAPHHQISSVSGGSHPPLPPPPASSGSHPHLRPLPTHSTHIIPSATLTPRPTQSVGIAVGNSTSNGAQTARAALGVAAAASTSAPNLPAPPLVSRANFTAPHLYSANRVPASSASVEVAKPKPPSLGVPKPAGTYTRIPPQQPQFHNSVDSHAPHQEDPYGKATQEQKGEGNSDVSEIGPSGIAAEAGRLHNAIPQPPEVPVSSILKSINGSSVPHQQANGGGLAAHNNSALPSLLGNHLAHSLSNHNTTEGKVEASDSPKNVAVSTAHSSLLAPSEAQLSPQKPAPPPLGQFQRLTNPPINNGKLPTTTHVNVSASPKRVTGLAGDKDSYPIPFTNTNNNQSVTNNSNDSSSRGQYTFKQPPPPTAAEVLGNAFANSKLTPFERVEIKYYPAIYYYGQPTYAVNSGASAETVETFATAASLGAAVYQFARGGGGGPHFMGVGTSNIEDGVPLHTSSGGGAPLSSSSLVAVGSGVDGAFYNPPHPFQPIPTANNSSVNSPAGSSLLVSQQPATSSAAAAASGPRSGANSAFGVANSDLPAAPSKVQAPAPSLNHAESLFRVAGKSPSPSTIPINTTNVPMFVGQPATSTPTTSGNNKPPSSTTSSQQGHSYSSTAMMATNFGYDDESSDYKIVVDDHIGYRYQILSELGRGSFGTVLRCYDHGTNTIVAVKIIKNKKKFHEQALVEVNLLQTLRDKDPTQHFSIVKVTDAFIFRSHMVVAFELHGMNLYELCKANRFQPLPMSTIKKIAYQLLGTLHYIRELNIVHCDLKPENILLCLREQSQRLLEKQQQHQLLSVSAKHHQQLAGKGTAASASAIVPHKPVHLSRSGHGQPHTSTRHQIDLAAPFIRVIDFGSSCYSDKRLYTYIQSRFYRAPEVIFGIPYSFGIDMWSLGCILCELANGYPIFPGDSEHDQIWWMIEFLGVPPVEFVDKSPRKKNYFDLGALSNGTSSPPNAVGSAVKSHQARNSPDDGKGPKVVPLQLPGTVMSKDKKSTGGGGKSPVGSKAPRVPNSKPLATFLKSAAREKDTLFVDFIQSCFAWDPSKRWSPSEALQHPWFQFAESFLPFPSLAEVAGHSEKPSPKSASAANEQVKTPQGKSQSSPQPPTLRLTR